MLLAAWKSLLGHKLRLILSTLAITLAVAFVAGSLIFTHLLGAAFTNIIKGTLADVNVALTGTYSQSLTQPVNQRAELTPVNLTAISGVPGVASVTGVVTVFNAYPIDKNGKVVGVPGAPAVASNWITAPTADGGRGIVLRSGRAPEAADEVVVDPLTLTKSGHQLGERIDISTPQGKISKTIVGTAEWGDSGSVGATYLFFTTAESQALFTAGKDVFLVAWVEAAPGVSSDVLASRVGSVLPQGFEAVSAKQAADSSGAKINESLGFLNTFLLVFAGISVLVASFLIVNTFTIIVAQRTRELALLRAVGAKRRQVLGSVLLEALAVGLLAASVGLLLGWALAWGIKGAFAGIGMQLGTLNPTLTWTAVGASYAVGVFITLLAATAPAVRASRVPPVTAMSGVVERVEKRFDRVEWSGLGLLVLGVAAAVTGAWVRGGATWWLVGGGLLAVLVGAALATPLIGRPLVGALGQIFVRTHGHLGTLAQRNVLRQPRRLAATSSALMIGLALVTTIAVLGSSAEATVNKSVKEGLRGDFQISSTTLQPFSSRTGDAAAALSGVGAVHRLKSTPVVVGTPAQTMGLIGMDEGSFDRVVAQTMVEGSFPTAADTAMISTYRANRSGWTMGEQITVATPTGQPRRLTIVGVFSNPDGMRVGGLVVNTATLAAITPLDTDLIVTIDLASGADAAAVRTSLDALVADEPTVVVTDQAEWAATQVGQISTVLRLLYALLGLALVIAVLGIVNTLALAVIERTREIGLLRAIGLTRPQVRHVITLEAIIIALLGSVLGIAIGLICGVTIRQVAASDGLSQLAIPWLQLAAFVGLAVVVGVVAAVWPARRAAKLDVLAAIATD